MLALPPLEQRYRFRAHLEQVLGADGSVRYEESLRGRLAGLRPPRAPFLPSEDYNGIVGAARNPSFAPEAQLFGATDLWPILKEQFRGFLPLWAERIINDDVIRGQTSGITIKCQVLLEAGGGEPIVLCGAFMLAQSYSGVVLGAVRIPQGQFEWDAPEAITGQDGLLEDSLYDGFYPAAQEFFGTLAVELSRL